MSWELQSLGNLLAPSGRDRAGTGDYPVLSITMKHGLVDQSDKFKKRVASANTSTYRIAYKNELVVGFPIDEGVLGFQTKYSAGIVSPAYNIWRLKDEKNTYIPYLERLLRTPQARNLYASKMQGAVARRRSLSKDDFLKLEFPFPHVNDQKRINLLLGKLEGLLAQRKQHLEQLDDLLKSVFLKMFGPSAIDYDDWPLVEIKDLAAKHKGAMRTGPFGSNLKHSEFTPDGEVAVLGIDNAVQNRFAWDKRRFITKEKYQELKNYTINPGDVIVTIMGTIGRSAVIPDDIPLAINTKHLAAITLNRELANPIFISYSIHSSPFILNQFNSKNRGAIMSGLNLGLIKETKIKRAPITLQNKFSEIHIRVDETKALYQESLNDLESLYGALSQKAFKGELDLSLIPMIPDPPQNLVLEVIDVDEPLPQVDDYPMDSAEGRQGLLKGWFQEFLEEEANIDNSFDLFWKSIKYKGLDYTSGETSDDNEQGSSFTLDDYDQLKNWVFKQLRSEQFEQTYIKAKNCITLQVAKA